MNYCQDGLQVYFDTEIEKIVGEYLGGYYELQAIDINGKPYFEMINGGLYGFWWDGIDSWWIGYEFRKGQAIGFAYYEKDVFCPNQLSEWNWAYVVDNEWYFADEFLGISCSKYISIQIKKKSGLHINVNFFDDIRQQWNMGNMYYKQPMWRG